MKTNLILGTCRLFNKPLIKSVIKNHSDRYDSIKYDVGEYYQADKQVIMNHNNDKKADITYKLWILNGEGTKDLVTRIQKAYDMYEDTNCELSFMIHTPTSTTFTDLVKVRDAFESLGLTPNLSTSNFYKEELEVFNHVFDYYPVFNQLETNLNSLQLESTHDTLLFMKENDILLESYGVIRRGQYMDPSEFTWDTDSLRDSEKHEIEGSFDLLDDLGRPKEFYNLEYAFIATYVILKHRYGLQPHIVISPNNDDHCLDWYYDLEIVAESVSTRMDSGLEILDRGFAPRKDSPDYTDLEASNALLTNMKPGHIYLAGPLFDRGQIANRYADEKFIKDNFPSLTMYNPINLNIEEWQGDSAKEVSCMTFYEKDMEEIKKANIMIADLDGMDPGTIAEVGIFTQRIIDHPEENLRLIVMASNWEFWNGHAPGEANPTLGINDFLEGCVRDTGFFVKSIEEVKNYLEDYVYDIELDNSGDII